ncbi:unnamed protein product [Coregonus sp. 'balchen']|nr:unnamed protein product [Coregonus sp. 'balchen']
MAERRGRLPEHVTQGWLNDGRRNNSTSPKIKVDLDSSTGKPLHSVLHLSQMAPYPLHKGKTTLVLEGNRCSRLGTLSKVFSAGLDIMEMYGTSPERCGEFWKAVQEMWLKLYGSTWLP